MAEESHLDEMRSAIRGDFARLAERRGDQELMRVGVQPERAEGDATTVPPALEAEEEHAPRSWLVRFFSP